MKYIIESSILLFFLVTNALNFEKLKKKISNILEEYDSIDQKMDLISSEMSSHSNKIFEKKSKKHVPKNRLLKDNLNTDTTIEELLSLKIKEENEKGKLFDEFSKEKASILDDPSSLNQKIDINQLNLEQSKIFNEVQKTKNSRAISYEELQKKYSDYKKPIYVNTDLKSVSHFSGSDESFDSGFDPVFLEGKLEDQTKAKVQVPIKVDENYNKLQSEDKNDSSYSGQKIIFNSNQINMDRNLKYSKAKIINADEKNNGLYENENLVDKKNRKHNLVEIENIHSHVPDKKNNYIEDGVFYKNITITKIQELVSLGNDLKMLKFDFLNYKNFTDYLLTRKNLKLNFNISFKNQTQDKISSRNLKNSTIVNNNGTKNKTKTKSYNISLNSFIKKVNQTNHILDGKKNTSKYERINKTSHLESKIKEFISYKLINKTINISNIQNNTIDFINKLANDFHNEKIKNKSLSQDLEIRKNYSIFFDNNQTEDYSILYKKIDKISNKITTIFKKVLKDVIENPTVYLNENKLDTEFKEIKGDIKESLIFAIKNKTLNWRNITNNTIKFNERKIEKKILTEKTKVINRAQNEIPLKLRDQLKNEMFEINFFEKNNRKIVKNINQIKENPHEDRLNLIKKTMNSSEIKNKISNKSLNITAIKLVNIKEKAINREIMNLINKNLEENKKEFKFFHSFPNKIANNVTNNHPKKNSSLNIKKNHSQIIERINSEVITKASQHMEKKIEVINNSIKKNITTTEANNKNNKLILKNNKEKISKLHDKEKDKYGKKSDVLMEMERKILAQIPNLKKILREKNHKEGEKANKFNERKKIEITQLKKMHNLNNEITSKIKKNIENDFTKELKEKKKNQKNSFTKPTKSDNNKQKMLRKDKEIKSIKDNKVNSLDILYNPKEIQKLLKKEIIVLKNLTNKFNYTVNDTVIKNTNNTVSRIYQKNEKISLKNIEKKTEKIKNLTLLPFYKNQKQITSNNFIKKQYHSKESNIVNESLNITKENDKSEIKHNIIEAKEQIKKGQSKEKFKSKIKQAIKNELTHDRNKSVSQEAKKEFIQEIKHENKKEIKNIPTQELKREPIDLRLKSKETIKQIKELNEEGKQELKEETKIELKEEIKRISKDEFKKQSIEETKQILKEETKVELKSENKDEKFNSSYEIEKKEETNKKQEKKKETLKNKKVEDMEIDDGSMMAELLKAYKNKFKSKKDD